MGIMEGKTWRNAAALGEALECCAASSARKHKSQCGVSNASQVTGDVVTAVTP
jgi:hypothetical protein